MWRRFTTTEIRAGSNDDPIGRDAGGGREITLRGEVLPIGGLKEKLLAAHRGGIKTVLIPHENTKDLVEIRFSLVNVTPNHRGGVAASTAV
jgi:ATP-dependent Lon protease